MTVKCTSGYAENVTLICLRSLRVEFRSCSIFGSYSNTRRASSSNSVSLSVPSALSQMGKRQQGSGCSSSLREQRYRYNEVASLIKLERTRDLALSIFLVVSFDFCCHAPYAVVASLSRVSFSDRPCGGEGKKYL